MCERVKLDIDDDVHTREDSCQKNTILRSSWQSSIEEEEGILFGNSKKIRLRQVGEVWPLWSSLLCLLLCCASRKQLHVHKFSEMTHPSWQWHWSQLRWQLLGFMCNLADGSWVLSMSRLKLRMQYEYSLLIMFVHCTRGFAFQGSCKVRSPTCS